MEFDKALSDLFRLQVPEAELTHSWGVNHITAVREVIQPSGGRGVLTEPRVVRDIVGQDLFLQPQQRVQNAFATVILFEIQGDNANALLRAGYFFQQRLPEVGGSVKEIDIIN